MQLWENATMQHSPGTTHSGISCVPTCCENIAEGILAVLVLEYLQRTYHNDSLYYVDTGAIRLAQKPEFLF